MFWSDVKLIELHWLKQCDLRDTCIQPTLQLRLFNIFNNETISKTLTVNFVEPKNDRIDLITYWDKGTPNMIALTISVKGIDPDYDFSRLCDSSATIFPFQLNNKLEVSGICFKVQLTFTVHFDRCPQWTTSLTDGTHEKTSKIPLAVAIGCLIIFLMLVNFFLILNRTLELGHKIKTQIKRMSVCKTMMSNTGCLNSPENSRKSGISSVSAQLSVLNLTKFEPALFTQEKPLSANSSYCNSVMQY
uniref:VASt domain-containing protein n=1 Tax=Setaria digitata TaxID=48799 RepID=A0A915PUR3_9BILA